MNNTGKIVLMGLAAIFMIMAFYAFVEWFAVLSIDPHTALKDRGPFYFENTEKAGLFLMSLFAGSFFFGIVSFIAYRNRRRMEIFQSQRSLS